MSHEALDEPPLFELTPAPDSVEQSQPVEDYSVHPVLGSFIGERLVAVSAESIDQPESLRELERYHWATTFVQRWYSPEELSPLEKALGPLSSERHTVDSITNQFAAKIIPCLMNPDHDEALSQFRAVVPNAIDEEMLLLTNDDEFRQLHSDLAQHLEDSSDDIEASITENLKNIELADKMQFSGKVTHSLERMLNTGIVVTINPDHGEQIKHAHEVAGEGDQPLTEYIKNDRILNVNGFPDSKISHMVHDYMDHLWTFALLEETGLLDKYVHMFDSIGNPEATNIYKREGEIVASIGFGVRYNQTMQPGFGPRMRSSQIEEHLDQLFVDGQLEPRHMDAYRSIKNMRKGSINWQSLGFSFSNYITELDEQRRKWGRIKQRDPRTKRFVQELDPLSPDFLCFFIDTHRELMSPRHKHRDDLFRFHLLLEEYLTSYAKGSIPQDKPLTLIPSELRAVDFSKTTLPTRRIKWIRNNPGFTATTEEMI